MGEDAWLRVPGGKGGDLLSCLCWSNVLYHVEEWLLTKLNIPTITN